MSKKAPRSRSRTTISPAEHTPSPEGLDFARTVMQLNADDRLAMGAIMTAVADPQREGTIRIPISSLRKMVMQPRFDKGEKRTLEVVENRLLFLSSALGAMKEECLETYELDGLGTLLSDIAMDVNRLTRKDQPVAETK